MKISKLILAATLAIGTTGVYAADLPGTESTPIDNRSASDPGLGATGFDDRPGPTDDLNQDAESGAIQQNNFQVVDRNRDGYISRDEATAYENIDNSFMELDENNDGQLSAEEFNNYHEIEER